MNVTMSTGTHGRDGRLVDVVDKRRQMVALQRVVVDVKICTHSYLHGVHTGVKRSAETYVTHVFLAGATIFLLCGFFFVLVFLISICYSLSFYFSYLKLLLLDCFYFCLKQSWLF